MKLLHSQPPTLTSRSGSSFKFFPKPAYTRVDTIEAGCAKLVGDPLGVFVVAFGSGEFGAGGEVSGEGGCRGEGVELFEGLRLKVLNEVFGINREIPGFASFTFGFSIFCYR